MGSLLQGFLLGLAYVMPIGTQNLYVINTALSKRFPFAYGVALIVIAMDISLALACYVGMGKLLTSSPPVSGVMMLLGSIFLLWFAWKHLRANVVSLPTDETAPSHAGRVARDAFIVTWMNPQAIIDGSVIIGGYRTTLAPCHANAFIVGICLASAAWFLVLTTVMGYFKQKLSPTLLDNINKACGLLMVGYGLHMLYTFFALSVGA